MIMRPQARFDIILSYTRSAIGMFGPNISSLGVSFDPQRSGNYEVEHLTKSAQESTGAGCGSAPCFLFVHFSESLSSSSSLLNVIKVKRENKSEMRQSKKFN